MKKIICMIAIMIVLFCPIVCFAEDINNSDEYSQLLDDSGANELYDYIPKDTQDILKNLKSPTIEESGINSITTQEFLSTILGIAKDGMESPIRSTCCILGVILICALGQTFKLSIGDNDITKVFNSICMITCATFFIFPISDYVTKGSQTINNSFIFTTAIAPITATILTAMGKTVTATSYSFTILTTADLISALYANILMPIVKMLLSFVIISPLSTQIKLSSFIKFIQKLIKWILGFTMTIFVSILSLQTAINSSTDNVATKATKFIFNNTIPVVGGAISDAFGCVKGYVSLLKNGIGTFGVITGVAFFLPIIVDVILWMLSTLICKMVCEILDLSQLGEMFEGVHSVLSMMFAILCCSMLFVIISSGTILTISN